jgi:hypothetical protein
VSLLKGVTEGLVALSAVIASGARLVNIIRAVMVAVFSVAILGDPTTGQTGLLPNLMPLYMLVALVAVMLLGVFTIAQFMTSYKVSSFGRIAGVLFLSAWLSQSGGVVMRGYDQLRVAIGAIFYNAARDASATLNLGLAGGETAVSPRFDGVNVAACVDLSRTNQPGEVPTCAGYGLAMAYLFYQSVDEPLAMKPSNDFQAMYWMVAGDPTNYYTASDDQLNALYCRPPAGTELLNNIGWGIERAALSIPLAVMGLLEQIVWFLLTLGVLALFISLAINLAFAALTPFGNGLSETVNQLVQMLVKTATTAFYLGLVIGLMLVTANNVAYFLGAGLLALAITTGLMLQASSSTFQALNAAGGGMAQSGMNAVMGVVGGAAVLRAARNVGGAVSGSGVGQYAGRAASSALQAGANELGFHNPIPDAQTLGRNVGSHAVAVLAGHVGDTRAQHALGAGNEVAKARRLKTAEREADYIETRQPRGPSWQDELRVVQQERRKDEQADIRARLRGDSNQAGPATRASAAGTGESLAGDDRHLEPYADSERRKQSDRRSGVDRRANARSVGAPAPVDAGVDGGEYSDANAWAGRPFDDAHLYPPDDRRSGVDRRAEIERRASLPPSAPIGETTPGETLGAPDATTAPMASAFGGQAALPGYLAGRPARPAPRAAEAGPVHLDTPARAGGAREPALWLGSARAALEAAQSNADPARAWAEASFSERDGDKLGGMTGQVRALAMRSSQAGMTGDAFAAVLAEAAQPHGEARALVIAEPYFLDPHSAKTYVQQARRVARWADHPFRGAGGLAESPSLQKA